MEITNTVDLIKHDEGLSLTPYKDIKGHLTIGYGFNIDTFDESDAEYFLEKKITGIQLFLSRYDFWVNGLLETARHAVIFNICYNVGTTGFCKFKKMIAALDNKDYNKAADEILDSSAARLLPVRYKRLADMMRSGEWPTIK